MARCANYTNMILDYIMEQMHFPRPGHFPVSYPCVPSWEELWREQQGGVGESGAGNDDVEDLEFLYFSLSGFKTYFFSFVFLFLCVFFLLVCWIFTFVFWLLYYVS